MIPVRGQDPRLDTEKDRAWRDLLDRLERDVEATERLLESPEVGLETPEKQPWEPPEIDGPLPDHLLERAMLLHRRQTAAREALEQAIARSRARARQQRSARPGRGAHATPEAAYLDVSA